MWIHFLFICEEYGYILRIGIIDIGERMLIARVLMVIGDVTVIRDIALGDPVIMSDTAAFVFV
jgi:hypothetical protein